MTVFQLCGLRQTVCLSARATGRRSENNLAWVIFGIAVLLIGISFYYLTDYFTPQPKIEKSEDSPFVVR